MNSITKLIITIITTLIVVVGVMIPLIGGLDDNIRSVEQNTTSRFLLTDNDLDLVIDCVEPGTYMINGREYSGTASSLVIGDGIYIYLFTSNYSIVDTNNNIVYVGNGTGNVITIEDGEYTHKNGSNTYTGTVETLLYPDERGNYGAFVGTGFNVDDGDKIYLISNRSGDAKFVLTMINGVERRADALIEPITSTTSSYSPYEGTLEITTTATKSDDGLSYAYSTISFTTDTGTNNAIVYAPIKYHVIDSAAETVRTIVNILPLIVLIGLILVAGYAVMASINNKTDI